MVIGRDRAASTTDELAEEALKKRNEEKLAAEQQARKETAEKIEKANIENKRAEIPEEMLPKRTHILNEIVQSELQYAWDLQVCVKVCLSMSKNWMSGQENRREHVGERH